MDDEVNTVGVGHADLKQGCRLVGLGIGEAPGAAALLLQLVNQERAAARLGPLESRGAIVDIASGQSRAMAGRGDIWHNSAYFTSATPSVT